MVYSNLQDALKAISDCGEWQRGIDTWSISGESADSIPDWTVTEYGKSRGTLRRQICWYVQEGDWDGYTELVALAEAMNAADKALCASLQASRKAGDP